MGVIDKKIRAVVRGSGKVQEEPLRIFAIAVCLGWEDIMKAAAHATLGVPQRDFSWCQELESLTAGKYQKLLQWRFACHDAVDRSLTKYRYEAKVSGFQGFHRESESKFSGPTSLAVTMLRANLAATGCPQSRALLDETTKNTFLRQFSGVHRSNLYEILEGLEETIDEALLKVPLDIKCDL